MHRRHHSCFPRSLLIRLVAPLLSPKTRLSTVFCEEITDKTDYFTIFNAFIFEKSGLKFRIGVSLLLVQLVDQLGCKYRTIVCTMGK